MMLQPHLAPQPREGPVHKTMQAYMDILCAAQREASLTMMMLQDIPMFDGQDSSNLEDWFMDIETTADILLESDTHLAEVKSCGLAQTLIHKATQAGKCWDEIKGILHLKLCNGNICTYTSHLWRYSRRIMKHHIAYIHHFKTAAK